MGRGSPGSGQEPRALASAGPGEEAGPSRRSSGKPLKARLASVLADEEARQPCFPDPRPSARQRTEAACSSLSCRVWSHAFTLRGGALGGNRGDLVIGNESRSRSNALFEMTPVRNSFIVQHWEKTLSSKEQYVFSFSLTEGIKGPPLVSFPSGCQEA